MACDVCTCGAPAHMMQVQAFTPKFPTIEEDQQSWNSHVGNAWEHGSSLPYRDTEMYNPVAPALRKQSTPSLQKQEAYRQKLRSLKDELYKYVTTSNHDITNFGPLFSQIWILFLESDAGHSDIRNNDSFRALVQKLVDLNPAASFDDYTLELIAAYNAFFLHDNYFQTGTTIPYDFLLCLLPVQDAPDTATDDVINSIAEYEITNDLSSDVGAEAMDQNEPIIDRIFQHVRMLQLYQYLYDFCSAQYTSLDKLKAVWKDLMHAYDAYKNDQLEEDFATYFSDTSESDMLDAGGEKVEAQAVDDILKDRTMWGAVQKIGLPMLLSVRKGTIRRTVIRPYLLKAFPRQQEQEALNSVLTELKATHTHTKDVVFRMLERSVYGTEIQLNNCVDILCHGNAEIQALDLLSKQVDEQLQSGMHRASSREFPKYFAKIGKMFTFRHKKNKTAAVEEPTQNMENITEAGAEINAASTNNDQENKTGAIEEPTQNMENITDAGAEINAASANNDQEKKTDENVTMIELCELIRKFCTLEETSVEALERLWVQITQKNNDLEDLWGHVGNFFNDYYDELHITSAQIHLFCTANTFKQAVEYINIKRLIEQAMLRPTKGQSTLLAAAHKCQLQLDKLGVFDGQLNERGVHTGGKTYAVLRKIHSTKLAELDKALGWLCEEREVLRRLLQELQKPQKFKAS